ncbi:hypothetical protein TSMEX_003554 [Taenia solium]|uniref:DUF1330 domain-containing protein n=1 Tax=Taenia asiatica TaxID=60517 RepID=A0A0R3W9N6_TAEAS|nr:unnamed protein product [Taenia asiatica]|eukprot:TsM_000570900 transcript=TsM_000570900 gene=TsM_000570900
MALIYVHFEYRQDSQTEPIKEIVNRYIDEKKLLLERPQNVSEYQPLTRILVSVDSEFVDNFVDELNKFELIAVKKHN